MNYVLFLGVGGGTGDGCPVAAGPLGAGGFCPAVTATCSPFSRASGGLMTTASSAVIPSRTSTLFPRSRPMVSFFSDEAIVRADHSRHRPSGRNSSALMGRVSRWPDSLASKCTCAYSPCSSVPVGLGTSTSVSRVRVPGSMASEVRTTWPQKLRAGILGEVQASLQSRVHGGRVGLRHGNIHAQRIGLREIKHFFGGNPAVAGIDQRADIHVARRDYAGKRRIDVLEDSRSSRRFTLASDDCTMACLAAKSPLKLSTSCCDTESLLSKSW